MTPRREFTDPVSGIRYVFTDAFNAGCGNLDDYERHHVGLALIAFGPDGKRRLKLDVRIGHHDADAFADAANLQRNAAHLSHAHIEWNRADMGRPRCQR